MCVCVCGKIDLDQPRRYHYCKRYIVLRSLLRDHTGYLPCSARPAHARRAHHLLGVRTWCSRYAAKARYSISSVRTYPYMVVCTVTVIPAVVYLWIVFLGVAALLAPAPTPVLALHMHAVPDGAGSLPHPPHPPLHAPLFPSPSALPDAPSPRPLH